MPCHRLHQHQRKRKQKIVHYWSVIGHLELNYHWENDEEQQDTHAMVHTNSDLLQKCECRNIYKKKM